MRLHAFLGAVTVAATVTTTGIAVASPPSGVITWNDHSRGQAAGAGAFKITAGTGTYVGSYTLPAGSTSGWRTQPGVSVLSVTSGVLKVVQAASCAAREYGAGEAAVVPAGTYLVGAAGGTAAEFVGIFDNLGRSGARPLVAGAEARAPKACTVGAAYREASGPVGAVDIAQGVFTPARAHGGHDHAAKASDTLRIPAGKDVFVATYTAAPGASTGWIRHQPGLAVVSKGQLSYYSPTDTGCAKVEEYHPGQAYSHADRGMHLAVNDGTENVVATVLYFGMPHSSAAAPVVGNQLDAIDFTPFPPAGCTRL